MRHYASILYTPHLSDAARRLYPWNYVLPSAVRSVRGAVTLRLHLGVPVRTRDRSEPFQM